MVDRYGDRMPDRMGDRMPDRMPDRMGDRMPDRMGDRMPDRMGPGGQPGFMWDDKQRAEVGYYHYVVQSLIKHKTILFEFFLVYG